MEVLPPGSSAASASALTAGISSSPEIRTGARTGAAIRTAAAIAARGLASSTSGHGRRALGVVGRGEDRERGPGGVGGRVASADPGRVLGRERGIAEFVGGLFRGGRRLGLVLSPPTSGAAPSTELRPLPPPRIAATRNTAARRIAPPTSFSGSGTLGRGRGGFGDFGGLGRLRGLRRPLPALPAGRNLRIYRSLSGHSGKLQAGTGWPVS